MMTGRSALLSPLSAARWLLILVLAAGVYFFHGFLIPVLAALVIGFASWPIYRRLGYAVGGSRTAGASLAILFIVAFLVVPVVMLGTYTFEEVREWANWAIETNRVGAPTPEW